ncbi:MAG: alanine racemase [Cyclobacteriaceae bacterium]|nr:alanine racemase [Cyclobacteriaceae bacterium]
MQITRPTLIIDEAKCRRNIAAMAHKASNSNSELIPHFKTHQSKEVGAWFKDYGVNKITVSSVEMAEFFADDGWDDIYIAFPCNPLEVERINRLAEKITLTVLFSNVAVIEKIASQLRNDVNARIEIDTGADRTGFKATSFNEIEEAIALIHDAERIHLVGFYSHAGQSYSARNKKEIHTVFDDMKGQLLSLHQKYKLPISCGDTPCCSVASHFDEFDSIHPGNFVFYDVMQAQIGSCSFDEIGVVLAAPVVDKNELSKEIVVHGGGVHLSKEGIKKEGVIIYGSVVKLTNDGWGVPIEDCYVKALSQEHGIIKVSTKEYAEIEIGDVIGILPIHSCLTADCMGAYYDLAGIKKNHLKHS